MYKIGDCFKIEWNGLYEYYMLAQVDSFMVTLIALDNGNRFDHPIEVDNPLEISDNIINQMIKSPEINCTIKQVTRKEAFINQK